MHFANGLLLVSFLLPKLHFERIIASEFGRGMPRHTTTEQILRDSHGTPLLQPGRPICSPYVHNGNIVAWDSGDLLECIGFLADELERCHISFRIEILLTSQKQSALGSNSDSRTELPTSPHGRGTSTSPRGCREANSAALPRLWPFVRGLH